MFNKTICLGMFCINSDVLSSFGLFYILRHKLQELLSAWLDRKIQNEHEDVSNILKPITICLGKRQANKSQHFAEILRDKNVQCFAICGYCWVVKVVIVYRGKYNNNKVYIVCLTMCSLALE